MDHKDIIALIRQEVKPALGCTEPIAVALAVAKAVEIIRENCPEVKTYIAETNTNPILYI